MGHQVVAVAETGRQLADSAVNPARHRHHGHQDAGHGRHRRRRRGQPRAANSDRAGIGATPTAICWRVRGAEYIMSYLVKPVKPADLQAAITLAVARFEQYRRVRGEAASLRQSLEDRKTHRAGQGRRHEPASHGRAGSVSPHAQAVEPAKLEAHRSGAPPSGRGHHLQDRGRHAP